MKLERVILIIVMNSNFIAIFNFKKTKMLCYVIRCYCCSTPTHESYGIHCISIYPRPQDGK